MKVFLTGGTGFIGQPLTENLLAEGWEVIVPSPNLQSPQVAALTKAGAHCIVGDVTDKESVVDPLVKTTNLKNKGSLVSSVNTTRYGKSIFKKSL